MSLGRAEGIKQFTSLSIAGSVADAKINKLLLIRMKTAEYM
jgi:hypothetical protein